MLNNKYNIKNIQYFKNKKIYKKIVPLIALSLLSFNINNISIIEAMPSNPSNVSGATIDNQSPNVMNINGTSNNSVIKWNDFSINKGETVNFSGMKNAMNYVTGHNISNIYGNLNGSGVNVYLINPNGVIFGESAKVNVGSLTVSTRNLTDIDLDKFKSDGTSPLTCISNSASNNGDIVNNGEINTTSVTFEGNNIIIKDISTLKNTDKISTLDNNKIKLISNNNIDIGY